MAARILLAEDNKMNQIAMQSLLERLGYEVLSVANGREGVEAYAAGHFDAVLMDCQMPGMDGFEATAHIRRQQVGNAPIPIIGLSGRALRCDKDEAIALGMDAYLTKPVSIRDLLSTLEHWTSGEHGGPVDAPDVVAP
jgi:two-component system sensor histidine kinase/response regulator